MNSFKTAFLLILFAHAFLMCDAQYEEYDDITERVAPQTIQMQDTDKSDDSKHPAFNPIDSDNGTISNEPDEIQFDNDSKNTTDFNGELVSIEPNTTIGVSTEQQTTSHTSLFYDTLNMTTYCHLIAFICAVIFTSIIVAFILTMALMGCFKLCNRTKQAVSV